MKALIKRTLQARATLQGIRESMQAIRDELVSRRPVGHRFWYAKGRLARWVKCEAFEVSGYTMPEHVAVKVGKGKGPSK